MLMYSAGHGFKHLYDENNQILYNNFKIVF